jgi:V/A-type H+-transporting ATPase subunit A
MPNNNLPVGEIYGVNGPVLTVRNCDGFAMSEMVMVSEERLIGEVIRVRRGESTVQVFEDTTGLAAGARVYGTGALLSVTLGPGIVGNIFDGIQRPLRKVEAASGAFIGRGVHVDGLDGERKWPVRIRAKAGEFVTGGAVVAEVQETSLILHKVMTPPQVSGSLEWVAPEGDYTLWEPLARVRRPDGQTADITLAQRWPIRLPRPVAKRQTARRPLITGQRVIDTLFPMAKGGTAAIPGGFGTGKTMTQHQLAKWSDADIILYIGCGERGNEMTQVLEEFSQLQDPASGRPLMDRTVLIANTSNMPVAAREASIYTGVTMAEYYRDMGYHVAIMADSTSRWAEALRELSGRLEEMPAEEGFPAYLASRLSSFYERAGFVETLGGAEGSVTIIGAVSPQGADFSEPVTQNTKRFVRCFWTLDRALAYARHFPAIQWLTSYSEYLEDLSEWYNVHVGPDFLERRRGILNLLQEESELMEIVKLIGADVLPDSQKLCLEIARVIRLGFVQQNAYHPFDTYVPFEKQMGMMGIILYLHEKAKDLLALGIPMNVLQAEDIFEQVTAMKYNVANGQPEKLEEYRVAIDRFYHKLYEKHA